MTTSKSFSAGGIGGRQGVSSVALNGYLYIAYTGTNTVDSKGDAPIYLTKTTAGAGNALVPGTQVTIVGPQEVLAASNPALTTDGTNLYLGWIDGFGGFAFVKGTPQGDGSFNWGTQLLGLYSGISSGLSFSPSMVVNLNTNTLYISVQNGPDKSLSLGQASTANLAVSWTNFPGDNDLGFGSNLAFFKNQLYIGYVSLSPSHNLYYWTTTDGHNLTFHTGAASDQSSTVPSLAVYKGYLYMAFRTNDGDHKLIWKSSSDGVNWSGNTSIGDQMGGPADLVDGTSIGIPHLINMFVANDPTLYVWGGETTN